MVTDSFLQNHCLELGRSDPQKNWQRDVLDNGKVCDHPTNSTTPSFREIVGENKNKFYSSHLKGCLAVVLCSRGALGEVLQTGMVPLPPEYTHRKVGKDPSH